MEKKRPDEEAKKKYRRSHHRDGAVNRAKSPFFSNCTDDFAYRDKRCQETPVAAIGV